MTWTLPLCITLIAAVGFIVVWRKLPRYPSYSDGLMLSLTGAIAIIVSLVAWLVWAVVT